MALGGRTWIRVVLSLWLCFHVFAILVLPNVGSYFGRRFSSLIPTYGAVIGLNLSWNFFSPDPAHTMYLKFTVFFDPIEGGRDPLEIYFPETKDSPEWDSSKRRDLYAMRFMVIDPGRVDTVLGPWMCRTHPGATRIQIEHVVNSIPFLDEAAFYREESVTSLGHTYDTINREYRCSQMGDEVL